MFYSLCHIRRFLFLAVSRRGLDMMRVRATDPRPCPKCGKIYRSAHTLRTHLEDKHTVCPGYRCVLCGTVAKSRNSLHSHMSRQHRGISTKDLPVVPMPAPFDPELASRLLAKAGVRVSAAELAARASPTGPRRSDLRLDLKNAGNNDRGYSDHHHHHQSRHHSSSAAPSEGGGSSLCGDDPEDLSVPARFDVLSPPNSNQQSVITKNKAAALMAAAATASGKSFDAIAHSLVGREALAAAAAAANSSTGSAILDTYLQMIAENAGGLAALGLKDQQAALVAATAAARARAAAAAENDKQRGGEGPPRERDRDRDRNRERPAAPPHLVPHGGEAEGGESSQDEEDDYSEEEEEGEAK